MMGTAIKPLGEEHLKMFQRKVGPVSDGKPRVNMENVRENLSLSEKRVMSSNAHKAARAQGGRVATLMEVLMNVPFLEKIKGSECFVDSKDAPFMGTYWHLVLRNKGGSLKCTDAATSEHIGKAWHECFWLSDDARWCIANKHLLLLKVGELESISCDRGYRVPANKVAIIKDKE